MDTVGVDIYYLIFASIFLFGLFVVFIILFFNQYRKRRKEHFVEKELMKNQFDKELLKARLEVQEKVFEQISQEIHDNVGQVLSLAKNQINIALEQSGQDDKLLQNVGENISLALNDLRDIAKSLNSDRIRSQSLISLLSDEITQLKKFSKIDASIVFEGIERTIVENNKLVIIRVIQEAIQNVVKHASASAIVLKCMFLESHIKISFKDNGTGFGQDRMSETKKVLIADDHAMFRKGLKILINLFPTFEVIGDVPNGKEVIKQLQAGFIPNVILLDIAMPEMDGFETPKWVRANYPMIKILALSTMESDLLIIRMLKVLTRYMVQSLPENLNFLGWLVVKKHIKR